MTKKILIINGPNLNLLGEREKSKYGEVTLDAVKKKCESHSKSINVEIKFEQSNVEGEIVTIIQKAKGIFDGSKSDTEIRSKLEMQYNAKGGEVLLERLTVIDPEYAKIVHQNNRKRLIRALEIYEITGKSPSEHFHTQEESKSNNVHVFTIFLNSAMSELENRIQERTEHMLKNGWITEVKNLKEKFPEVTLHPLDSIGYRQILDHLDNKLAYEDMVKEIHLRTRQYAKKQIQWFKNECCDLTLDVSQKTNYAQQIEKIINKWKTLSKKTPETK